MDTAVLLLTFNRPDTTERVLKAIAQAKPNRLYVASDGPRRNRPEDRSLIEATREVVAHGVDWDCEVKTLYRENNLGARRGVVSAIDWFFENEPEGIILEDDCLPHPDFFPYCEQLLERYRDDERVWAVQGDNSARIKLSGEASYSFIPYALIWGWATWRRAWQQYDRDLDIWREIRNTPRVKQLWPDRIERRLRSEVLDAMLENSDSAWDYQWTFTVSYYGGLTTLPRRNLVSNIGWGRPDATHTTGTGQRQDAPTFPILPLVHPTRVEKDPVATSDALNGRLIGAGKYRLRFKLMKLLRQTIRGVSLLIRGLLGRIFGRAPGR